MRIGTFIVFLWITFYCQAQRLEILHRFQPSEGGGFYAPLVEALDGSFYGTTLGGGSNNCGTVFRITTNSAFTIIASFNPTNASPIYSPLIQGMDGDFYGTSLAGGNLALNNGAGVGTVFKITTNGVIAALTVFNYTNGAFPFGLVQASNGDFYGTTVRGGDLSLVDVGWGTIFKVTTNGELTTLVAFDDYHNGSSPFAGLTLGNDGNFYGTTSAGGSPFSGPSLVHGTVFRVTPTGLLTTLSAFNATNGGLPNAIIQGFDGSLFGTTSSGGTNNGSGYGTVFKATTNGALNAIAWFDGTNGSSTSAGLVQGSDGTLYGTTPFGGKYQAPYSPQGSGNVFEISPAGNITTLISFNYYDYHGNSASGPNAAVIIGRDGNLYGTAEGGSYGSGGVFRIVNTPRIVTGPTNETVDPNKSATFTIVAATHSPMHYQWYFNTNTPIAGATNATLSLASVQNSEEGDYSVDLINACGTNTASAHLFVNGAPTITESPTNRTVIAGFRTVFQATAAGRPLFYQWRFNNLNLPGATLSSMTLNSVSSNQVGSYSVVVSNQLGTATSQNAILTLSDRFKFEVLHDFVAGEGRQCFGELVEGNDGYFYGVSRSGGTNGSWGTAFKVSTQGALTTLLSFNNTNGANPQGPLVLAADGNFYGSTSVGGVSNSGTIFRMSSSGALTTLVTFDGANGSLPQTGLIQTEDGNLYGTTSTGGFYDFGTIFRMDTNGALTTLYAFDYTNGANPAVELLQIANGDFYGTTYYGGNGSYGTVFKMTTNGVLTSLVNFDRTNGRNPLGKLIQASNGKLYGTTWGRLGGFSTNDGGTVFELTTDGLFNTLISFDPFSDYTIPSNPYAGLVQAKDSNFYGTTYWGGEDGNGTVFQITPEGILTTIISFDFYGGAPRSGLTVGRDGNLYGTTSGGGTSGGGAVFRIVLSMSPNLKFGQIESGIILTWPTNEVGYSLQSSLDLNSPTNWIDSTNLPAEVGGQFVVTNSISGSARFFRLKK